MIKHGPPSQRTQKYDIVVFGEVCQYTTRVMRLTRGRLWEMAILSCMQFVLHADLILFAMFCHFVSGRMF
jgi:hypothetical protein